MYRLLRVLYAPFAIGAMIAVVSSMAYAHDEHFEAAPVKRSVIQATIPAVTLVREDGVKVDAVQLFGDSRPIYLNFIFTSCTTVCPVMNQIFSVLQDRLGADRDNVLMMSVSIDPEHDTPVRLALVAEAFGATPQWRFYTGTNGATLAVQKAFGLTGRDKMNHPVANFFRPAPGRSWVRIDGFAGAEQLEAEYRMTKGKQARAQGQ